MAVAKSKAPDGLSRYRGRLFQLANQIWTDRKDAMQEDLHALVYDITGKESITMLNQGEFLKVIHELEQRLPACSSTQCRNTSASKEQRAPEMATAKQEKKAFLLMYELIKYDAVPDKTTAGVRMRGVIKKVLGLDVGLEEPFKWVSASKARLLINTLKGYVDTEEHKALHKGAGAL